MDLRFRDHFENPRGLGELAEVTARVRVVNPACGDVLDLSVLVKEQRIVDMRFRARGCSSSIAAASALVERVTGCDVEGAGHVQQRDLEELIGDLPALSRHAFDLALEALEQLLRKL